MNMPMSTLGERPVLLVIDVQQGFADAGFWGTRNNPECEANIEALIRRWRREHLPIAVVQHDSDNPASPLHPSRDGNALLPFVLGADVLIRKSVNSAFHGEPDLQAWLTAQRATAVVICGITTNHCCETTARLAGNLGHPTVFVLDATHTFDRVGLDGGVIPADTLARVTAANLHEEFATVVQTADLLG